MTIWAVRVGLALGMGALLVACGDDQCVPHSCPYVRSSFTVVTPAGGPIEGVEATIEGKANAFSCTPTSTGAVCQGNGATDNVNGVLYVTAPGFQPLSVDSKIQNTPAQGCGCPDAGRQPSTVTLTPKA